MVETISNISGCKRDGKLWFSIGLGDSVKQTFNTNTLSILIETCLHPKLFLFLTVDVDGIGEQKRENNRRFGIYFDSFFMAANMGMVFSILLSPIPSTSTVSYDRYRSIKRIQSVKVTK